MVTTAEPAAGEASVRHKPEVQWLQPDLREAQLRRGARAALLQRHAIGHPSERAFLSQKEPREEPPGPMASQWASSALLVSYFLTLV